MLAVMSLGDALNESAQDLHEQGDPYDAAVSVALVAHRLAVDSTSPEFSPGGSHQGLVW